MEDESAQRWEDSMKEKQSDMLRQEFKSGKKVKLDENYRNTSIVEVITQTPDRLFTTIFNGSHTWDVMTICLSKI